MNAQTYQGLNLFWGLGHTTFSVSNALGIFQSNEVDNKLDEVETRDQRGNVVTWTGYNPTQEAMVEYYIGDNTSNASGSAAITLGTSVPDRGSLVTITTADSIASGSNWIVKDALVRETNTDNAKCTLKLTRYPAVQ